jgi:GAF domain-containing protein
LRELLGQTGAASVLITPLVMRNQVLGVILLHGREACHRFTDEESRLVDYVANISAICIERARLEDGLS